MSQPTTPNKPKRREYDTVKRARFFDAYDSREKCDSLGQICRKLDFTLPHQTASYWLRQREKQGSPAYRRTRRLSSHLGRSYTTSEKVLDALLDPEDPAHSLRYEGQVKAKQLAIKPKTLQQNFAKRKGAYRFKKPRIKRITAKNRAERVRYGKNHQNRTITGFWKYIYFTDEAHFNSLDLATVQEYDLHVPDGNIRLSRLQEKSSGLNVTVHVAAGISYDYKGPLIFYNDPLDPGAPKPYKPIKPRRGKFETLEHWQKEVLD